jgi:quinol monooxygenase YgiN
MKWREFYQKVHDKIDLDEDLKDTDVFVVIETWPNTGCRRFDPVRDIEVIGGKLCIVIS